MKECDGAVGGERGVQVPDSTGVSLCVSRSNTPSWQRPTPGYLHARQRPRASRVGHGGAQHPPRPAGSLCSSSFGWLRAAPWPSVLRASPKHPRVRVSLERGPPSTWEGPLAKSSEIIHQRPPPARPSREGRGKFLGLWRPRLLSRSVENRV